jgi:hypothetical protein
MATRRSSTRAVYNSDAAGGLGEPWEIRRARVCSLIGPHPKPIPAHRDSHFVSRELILMLLQNDTPVGGCVRQGRA